MKKKSTLVVFIFVFLNIIGYSGNEKSPCVSEIYLPENYIASGDAINELFIPKITGVPLNYSFQIFNRRGEEVFETTDINAGWNGTNNNKPVQPDVYSWTISYFCEESQENYKISGTVTVFI